MEEKSKILTAVGQLGQLMVRRQRLWGHDIQASCTDLASLQGCDECILLDHTCEVLQCYDQAKQVNPH